MNKHDDKLETIISTLDADKMKVEAVLNLEIGDDLDLFSQHRCTGACNADCAVDIDVCTSNISSWF